MRDVVLITIDSLRHDHVGCYGYDRNTTPNIDEVASESYRFSNAFSHAGMTKASFPSILTSSFANMYGGFERISDGRTLISEVLSKEGYTTAAFHSNLFLGSDFGYKKGFDTFFDSKTEPSLVAKLRQMIKTNLDPDSVFYTFLQSLYDTTERKMGVNVGSFYVTADEITDRSINWVKDVSGGSRRFLWTHYMDVHHPYVPPEEFQLEFRDSPISDRNSIKLRRKMLESPNDLTTSEIQDLINLYDAEIRFTDAEIGRLITEVKNAWGDDTIVIITSDHGEEFYDHGGFSHSTVYEEGIHVPLILHTGSGSRVFEEIVGLIDVSPTIADYVGSEIPDNFYGQSLQPLVESDEWDRDYVIGDWGGNQGKPDSFFYRDHKWKYISGNGDEQLFRIDEDPSEKNNIVNKEPPILETIKSIINDHQEMIEKTSMDIEEVEMDEVVEDRLKKLGYR